MASADPFYDLLKRLDAQHEAALSRPALTAPLRLGSYLAYRGLEVALGDRHPHERVVSTAAQLQRAHRDRLDATPSSGRRILFFTVRGWFAHVGTEAVLAKALQLRGATVKFFLCSGGLSQCDFKPPSDPHVTRPLCWRCTGFARRLLDAFELPTMMLADVVGPEVVAMAAREVRARSRDALERWEYRGLPLYRFCMPSIMRSQLTAEPGYDEQSERVVRGQLESAVVFVEACRELLRRERPDAVVLTNGMMAAERIMLELATAAGIRADSYEMGAVRNSVSFAHDQPSVLFDLSEPWPAYRDRPLATAEDAELDDYLAKRSRGAEGPDLWPEMQSERDQLATRLGIPDDRRVVVAFPNVIWDTATFERDHAFGGVFDWLTHTVEAFRERPDLILVIRAHPAEVRLPMLQSRDRVADRLHEAFAELPPNVRVIPPDDQTDSYMLAERADCVLVYTSTLGLESAVRGKPVVVAGTPHYRGCGFTHDVEERGAYFEQVLAAADHGSVSEEAQGRARRYAHLFFFRFMHPFPWLTFQPRGARQLNVGDLSELAPGRDRGLDRLCAAIQEGAPFIPIPDEG